MMKYIQLLTEKINNKTAASIKEIIRCKNGWSLYDPEYPQYTDIKLNVLVQSMENKKIIAEIQLLLNVMSKFKKVSHKLYSVERQVRHILNHSKYLFNLICIHPFMIKLELVYNNQVQREIIETFKDNKNEGIVAGQLVAEHDVSSFIALLENTAKKINLLCLETDEHGFANSIIFTILLAERGEIHNYLLAKHKIIYQQALLYFIESKVKNSKVINWYLLLKETKTKRSVFIRRISDLCDGFNEEEISKNVLFKLWNGSSLFQVLSHNEDIELLEYALLDERSAHQSKCKLLGQCVMPTNFDDILDALRKRQNNKKKLKDFTMIFEAHRMMITFKTPYHENAEFKVVEEKNEGTLYCFGEGGDKGILGLGTKYDANTHCGIPSISPIGRKIKSISTGSKSR